MKPLFSVVIPLYNAVEYIHRSISSVLTQTFQNLELIVVDDGSTDGSGDTVETIQDPRIRLIRQNNAGVGSARNRGIIEAKGEYIAFLDADDKWEPTFLDVISELLSLYPEAGIYSTGFRMVFPRGPNVEVTIEELRLKTSQLVCDYFWKAAGSAFIQTSGVVIPRYLISEMGMFLVGLIDGEDLELWTRIALRYPIAYDCRILFNYYQTGTVGKPRFSKSLRVDPILTMLRNCVSNAPDNIVTNNEIKGYISRHLGTMRWRFVRGNDREGLTNYLAHNNLRLYGMSESMIKRIPGCWLGLRLFCFLETIKQSRIMLMVRGKRKSHDVIQRIGHDSKSCP